jgi:hypothetical protein
MNASEICQQAAALVSGDRRDDYGSPAECLGRVAALWSAYLGITVTAKDVAALMILLKVARSLQSSKLDSAVDACGYAGLMGELME